MLLRFRYFRRGRDVRREKMQPRKTVGRLRMNVSGEPMRIWVKHIQQKNL
jgi:hypothetical protein